jgi:hypothetical protein
MTEDELKQAVYNEIFQAEGYETDELAAMREDALNYYNQSPGVAPSAPGRSAVRSGDVADMVEAVTAQIMPSFEGQDIGHFEPMSEDDVEQANSESDAVNYVVLRQNNGFYEIQQAIKDALLLRNGFLKVYLDEKLDTRTEKYDMLTEMQWGQLNMSAVENIDQVDNGHTVEGGERDDMPGFYEATVTIKTTERKIAVSSVDPVNMSWSQGWDSIYLQECPFVSEREWCRRSDLVEMGYNKDLVASLPPGGYIGTDAGENARSRDNSGLAYDGQEPSQDLIEKHECYIRIDKNGDGIGELLKVVVASNVLLEWEEAEYVPYASGSPFVYPHRFNGLSLYDKLKSVEDAKTSAIRQLLDNQNHANNSRVGYVEGMVNEDHLTNSRPGGGVAIESPDALVPFPFTDVGPSCINTLDYLDKQRAERGGASLDMVQPEAQIAGDTAHGVERQMTAKEQMAALFTRCLADTLVKTAFELTHLAMRLYVTEPMTFRVNSAFIEVNPANWAPRERVVIQAGLSNAERMRKRAQIEAVIADQQGLVQAGLDGIMVTPQNMYQARADWFKVTNAGDISKYYTDPTSDEAQQAAAGKAEQAQQAQAYQQSLVDMQKEVELRKADNADAKVMEDGRQFDRNLDFEYWKVEQENGVKEAELATKTALEMVSNEPKDGRDESAGEQSAA